ncbi:MAG: hypothetical protein COC01_07175 [Bacteroidetes bacterium]|nr:MAG: hypothetical protein COC01_07175 [Bacteroidota bacterium]
MGRQNFKKGILKILVFIGYVVALTYSIFVIVYVSVPQSKWIQTGLKIVSYIIVCVLLLALVHYIKTGKNIFKLKKLIFCKLKKCIKYIDDRSFRWFYALKKHPDQMTI